MSRCWVDKKGWAHNMASIGSQEPGWRRSEDFREGGLASLLAATTPLPAATPAPLHPAATTTTTAALAVAMYGTPNKDYLHYYTAVIIVLTTTPLVVPPLQGPP